MLVLFESPAGYALFKMSDEGKLENPDDLHKEFETPAKANKAVKLKAFSKFENTTEALAAVTALVEGKFGKDLKKFLSDEISEKELKKEQLMVSDPKLGGAISKKLGIKVVSDSTSLELYRGIRSQLDSLLTGLAPGDMAAMSLGLAHSLSRYKLKFSPDKVDTMIVQAIALLDDLDKELNIYAMRVKEWYGWHFPEMTKLIVDNVAYAKVIKAMGFRSNAATTDFSELLPEELEKELKDAAEISMGTEISEEDIVNITHLSEQIISITEYRTQLYDYLKNRMAAIAPNLTTLVGELVGARLISHAGSLMNLAKHPASTVQILGAEKALFRALKTKHDTPKYGLIYHASLIGQADTKNKGKIARMLSTKAAISIRVDALGDKDTMEVGVENRAKIETRVRQLAARAEKRGDRTPMKNQKKYTPQPRSAGSYNASADITTPKTPVVVVAAVAPEVDMETETPEVEIVELETPKKEKKEKKEKKDKKRKHDSDDEDAKKGKKEKKEKKGKKEKKEKKSKK